MTKQRRTANCENTPPLQDKQRTNRKMTAETATEHRGSVRGIKSTPPPPRCERLEYAGKEGALVINLLIYLHFCVAVYLLFLSLIHI